MLRIHVDPDLDELFKKLTAQIGAQPGLGTQLLFEAPSDLRVNIDETQLLTLG